MAGEWKQVGGSGEWANTQACVGLGGKIFAISSGLVYRIDPSGSWEQLGDSSGWEPRFLLGGLAKLYTLEGSGTVFEIDPFSGLYEKVSNDGQWASTLSATHLRDTIITCDQDGALYRYSPKKRSHERLPVEGTWKSRLLGATNAGLFTNDNAVVTVEQSGSMYAINLASGQYAQIDGDWSGTRVLVGLGASVYAITHSGGIYAIDPVSHRWSQVGTANTWTSRLACATKGTVIASKASLYTLEDSGTFYEVTVE